MFGIVSRTGFCQPPSREEGFDKRKLLLIADLALAAILMSVGALAIASNYTTALSIFSPLGGMFGGSLFIAGGTLFPLIDGIIALVKRCEQKPPRIKKEKTPKKKKASKPQALPVFAQFQASEAKLDGVLQGSETPLKLKNPVEPEVKFFPKDPEDDYGDQWEIKLPGVKQIQFFIDDTNTTAYLLAKGSDQEWIYAFPEKDSLMSAGFMDDVLTVV